MKISQLAVALLALVSAPRAAMAEEEIEQAKVEWRTLEVTLRDAGGKPVENSAVELIGIDRGSMYNRGTGNEMGGEQAGWHFTTNAEGRCKVRLGCFAPHEAKKLTGRENPGFGSFHLLVDGGESGFVVSPRILNPDEPVKESDLNKEARHEWEKPLMVLEEKSTALDLTLRPGIKIKGLLTNPEGKPLKGRIVAWSDLHMESHTGFGGAVFRREVVVDGSGKFTINGVYPNAFYLATSLNTEPGPETGVSAWLRTRVRDQWVDDAVDRIVPDEGEREMDLQVVIAPESPHLFHGRITAPDGKPVAGAKVTLGVSPHREAGGYFDADYSEEARTNDKGYYEARSSWRYLRYIKVEADTFESANKDFENRQPPFGAPGSYDIKLEKEMY